ncbi:MAG TPA: 50S ribosomal protein L25 [Anaerolineales bacterium]|nr:50S ribosomal protein L25 [Anaerolineales bacterium]
MEKIVLQATSRQVTGKQVRALRREGLLPAVVYGRKIEPYAISLPHHVTSMALEGIGGSTLMVVEVEGKPHNVVVRQKQRHPVTGSLLHLDFQEVSMTEKMRAMVRLELVGTAPAVTELDGVMVTGQEVLEIECLPGNLPETIEVSLEGLKNIGDGFYVSDLQVPQGVEILTDHEEMIVLITAPLSEAALDAMESVGEVEPEVIEKGKKEEDEEQED